MTPAQRLYCEVLRTARGKAISLKDARISAHDIVNVYSRSKTGARKVRRLLPTYPWPLIEAPPTQGHPTHAN